MAKLNDAKFGNKKTEDKAKKIETENKTPVVNDGKGDPKPKQKETDNKNAPDLSSILERLDTLEKENKALREKDWGTEKSDPKKKYDWPRLVSYKMRGWIPVLSYTSEKKDKTRDWSFKNEKWLLVSNHNLVLSLANDKEIKVDVNEFWQSFERSEKMEVKNTDWNVIKLGMHPDVYVFDTEAFGDIKVLSNIIN